VSSSSPSEDTRTLRGDFRANLPEKRNGYGVCAPARGHLYDPYWTRHAARERGDSLPWPGSWYNNRCRHR